MISDQSRCKIFIGTGWRDFDFLEAVCDIRVGLGQLIFVEKIILVAAVLF